jgi:hypothetical protein
MTQRFGITHAELQFEAALEAFAGEADIPNQYLYVHLAVHAIARDDDRVVREINRNLLFWNTVLHALQLSTFISLHRLFDAESSCNADHLLKMAEEGAGMFSRAALGARIQRRDDLDEVYDWVAGAHEATADDFRRLRGAVRARRNVYDEIYRPIRGRIFAHRVADEDQAFRLFQATRIAELQEICTFFPALHSALFGLYFNGGRLELPARITSVDDIRAGKPAKGVHKDIVQQAERVMTLLSRVADFEPRT